MQGAIDQADQAMQSLLRSAPDHPEVALCAINLLWFSGKQREAYARGIDECRRFPLHVGLWSQWVQFAAALGEHDALVEMAEREALPELDDAGIQCALGCSFAAKGARNRALRHFEAAVRVDPSHVVALHNLGHTLSALGYVTAAESPLRRAIAIDPALAEAHNNLSIVLQKLNRHEEAIESARSALHLEPESVRFHCQYAALLEQSCLWSELEPVREKLMQLVEREISETQTCSMPPLLAISLDTSADLQKRIAAAYMEAIQRKALTN